MAAPGHLVGAGLCPFAVAMSSSSYGSYRRGRFSVSVSSSGGGEQLPLPGADVGSHAEKRRLPIEAAPPGEKKKMKSQAYTRGRFRVSCLTCCVTQPATLCSQVSEPFHTSQQQQSRQRRSSSEPAPHQPGDAAACGARDQCGGCDDAQFHDCAASRSSLDSTSSLVNSCTDDGYRRAGILRRAGGASCSGYPAAGTCGGGAAPRRVRFSDAGPPPSAAAAVAAAAARPGAASVVLLPSAIARGASVSLFEPVSPFQTAAAATLAAKLETGAPGSPAPMAATGLAAACEATPPHLSASLRAAAANRQVADLPQAVTRSYQRGRFAVQEGVLLLEPGSGSPLFQSVGLHMTRCSSMPDAHMLSMHHAATAAAAAAVSGALPVPASNMRQQQTGVHQATGGSCPELPTLAEEEQQPLCKCDSTGSVSTWGSGSALEAAVADTGAGVHRALTPPPGVGRTRSAPVLGLAGECSSALKRPQSVSYFRRGRFMVSTVGP